MSNSVSTPIQADRKSFSGVSAEDGITQLRPPAPPNPPPHDPQPVCLRQTSRQATSAVAYECAEPEEDDPLLSFKPYLHAAPRSNSITPERQRRFVATLAATGIVSQAARSIGKSMEALYKLRARPGAEGFAAAWDEAQRWGAMRLEDCALERALASPDDLAGNSMLAFVLKRRDALHHLVDVREIVPGHPVYEAIRVEVAREAGWVLERIPEGCTVPGEGKRDPGSSPG